jgi:hypothetical protein
MDDVGYCNNAERKTKGHKLNRFPAEYDGGIKGKLKYKRIPEEIYKHFPYDKICKLTAQQTSIYLQQKIKEKTYLNKMKKSQGKEWVLTNKDEINVFLQYYS